jgi:hypothetical protein
MPVAVVVGIALHSLMDGKLLYSVSATILTVGLMLVCCSSGYWGSPFYE